MELKLEGIKNTEKWKELGYIMPEFNLDHTSQETKHNPIWVHFGSGNIFRALLANRVQDLLNRGIMDRGIIAVEGFDYDIVHRINKPHDNLFILATLKNKGDIEKRVVASVTESLAPEDNECKDMERLREIFENPSLQMVTFTITEKAYNLQENNGVYKADVLKDFENPPLMATSYMGKVAALLYHRFINTKAPLALVSMDNCSENGSRLFNAIFEFATHWAERGFASNEFLETLKGNSVFSFPWTMIDKITPRPDEKIGKILEDDGIVGIKPIITEKNTYIAPFVNAEEYECLIIEDDFPGKRPLLEEAGFIFTDREGVKKAENMKVCTCLNPLHTALAIFGCLLGYTSIATEMEDELLKKMVYRLGYEEGLPVVENPEVIEPENFLRVVLKERLSNKYLPDTPQRIATDTSQKLGIRFGETVIRHRKKALNEKIELKIIPLIYAGWLRYLMAVDDCGALFELSPDPKLEELRKIIGEIKLGEQISIKKLEKILKDTTIFGVDLCEYGMGEQVTEYFNELNRGIGAVGECLNRVLSIGSNNSI